MGLPAAVTCVGVVALLPLSPLLIFGWGPLPGLGIAGGALALLLYYAVGTAVLAAYLWRGRSPLRPSWALAQLRRPLFADILRVGLLAALSAVSTNLAIGVATALVGHFGPAAIAGYGTAARLEYLLVPLVFGLGAPLVSMVGTCMGAGLRERALRAALMGAAMAAALTEAVGLAAAIWPRQWLGLFGSDPAMLEAGTQYLRLVGPTYGFFGLGLALYFASQGAGRLRWPVAGNLLRLAVAAGGGIWVLQAGGGLVGVFAVQGLALLLYGLCIASAIAGGAWFGRVGWPRSTSGLLRRLESA
jgi:Na+-driven multidrug efflux pump